MAIPIIVSGFWFLVSGSGFQVPGSRFALRAFEEFQVSGSWFNLIQNKKLIINSFLLTINNFPLTIFYFQLTIFLKSHVQIYQTPEI
jgi:hypothetical protein